MDTKPESTEEPAQEPAMSEEETKKQEDIDEYMKQAEMSEEKLNQIKKDIADKMPFMSVK